MSFGIALSGIDASQSDLNVISNNIANANTDGYKSSTGEFSELFATSPEGISQTQTGNGVEVSQVKQSFTQGDLTSTGNSLDLAMSGEGFFVIKNSGTTEYTRAGSFETNSSGYVVDSSGNYLQVYAPTGNGTYNTSSLQNLQLVTSESAPSATTTAQTVFNLPSNATAPTDTTFSASDSSSYNDSTSLTVYDSEGAAHTATLYFKSAGSNSWDVYETVDGTQVNANADPVTLTYNSSGALTSATNADGTTPTSLTALSFGSYTPVNSDGTATGAAAINMTYDFSKTTQYGSTFAATSITQNGYTTGTLSGISIGSDGVVQANFTNGQSTNLGQVAVATFANQNGLQQVGNTAWVQTYASGQALYGQAGSGGVGDINSGSVEDSNVDITSQLVNMIEAQRNFQANAQVITTQDQITQTIIQIGSSG